MLIEIIIQESTLLLYAIILIFAFGFIIREIITRTNNKYQIKTEVDKKYYQDEVIKLKFKEQEISNKYNSDKVDYDRKVAEMKLKAIELAKIEFDKFKQDELKKQTDIILENSLTWAKNVLAKWIVENELRIRKDASNRSVRNVLGKVTEHLIPFSEQMSQFNPKDVRFVGSPIDLIVFDGAEELKKGEITIYFIEVKTGTSALSKRQQMIREAIRNKKVEWLQLSTRDFGDEVNEALSKH